MGVFDLFKGKEQKNETNIVYVSVNEVSVIIRPKIQKSDGKIIFYDLSGNRVPKIPRGKRDISIDHNCYLDKPSRTIVAHLKNDNNGYIHYGKTPRGISPREAARIQSFPDWYKFEGPLSFQFKQIGNAVPPKVAYVFAKIFHNFLTGGIEKAINSNNN